MSQTNKQKKNVLKQKKREQKKKQDKLLNKNSLTHTLTSEELNNGMKHIYLIIFMTIIGAGIVFYLATFN